MSTEFLLQSQNPIIAFGDGNIRLKPVNNCPIDGPNEMNFI